MKKLIIHGLVAWVCLQSAAVFAAAGDPTLTVNVTGTGTVNHVTGTPTVYPTGTEVVLTAFPAAGSGYAFQNWTGDTFADASLFTQTVTMDGDKTVTANFTDQNTLTLTILNANPTLGDTDPVVGDYSYLAGQFINVTEIPKTGDFFGGWTERLDTGTGFQDVGITFVQSTFDEQITNDMELTAHFGPSGYAINILDPIGLGGLYPEPGSYNLSTGTQFVLKASLAPPWTFKQWEDGASHALTTNLNLPVTVDSAQTFQAVFELPDFVLTLIQAGAGGGVVTPTASPGGTTYSLTAGTVRTLTALPDSNSVFTGWSGDLPTGVDPKARSIDVTMDMTRAITATFVIADHLLTVQVVGTTNNVDVTPAPGQYGYLEGDVVELAALPANGSAAAFDHWSGDVDTQDSFASLVMDDDKTVFAHYVDDNGSNTYLLTVVAPEGPGTGATTPVGPGAYRYLRDRTVSFLANPADGSYFNGWRQEYAGENRPDALDVVMSKDRTIGAAFSLTGAELTVALTGQGAIRPVAGVYAVAKDLVIPFTASRTDMGWVFTGWYRADDSPIHLTANYSLTVTTNPAGIYVNGVFKHDTTPPEIIVCPPDAELEPNMACQWTLPNYRALVTAQDDYGPIDIQQTPAPNTLIDTDTEVTITVSDDSTDSLDTTCTFQVTLKDSLGYCRPAPYNVDPNQDMTIDLTELMRIVQFYNTTGGAYHCSSDPGATEDGFLPGLDAAAQSCTPSSADTDEDFIISLSELLRVIQLFGATSYFQCGDQSSDSDGVCPGMPSRLRLVHASTAAPNADLCIDANKRFFDLATGEYTVYVNLIPGVDRTIKLLAAGLPCDQQPIIQLMENLQPSANATYVIAGDVDLYAIADDLTPPSPGTAKVRMLQMNTQYPYMDLMSGAGAGAALLFSDVAYGTGSSYVELTAGLQALTLRNSADDAILGSTISVDVADGEIVTLVFYGDDTTGIQMMRLDD